MSLRQTLWGVFLLTFVCSAFLFANGQFFQLQVYISSYRVKSIETIIQSKVTTPLVIVAVESTPGYKISTVQIGGVTITADVADTEEKRVLGLSGRDGLSTNQGMLFVFDSPGIYGFWMRDMNFSIDILWMDKNENIVDLVTNLSSATYPKVFEPKSESLYVLELPAGYIDAHNIKIGEHAQF